MVTAQCAKNMSAIKPIILKIYCIYLSGFNQMVVGNTYVKRLFLDLDQTKAKWLIYMSTLPSPDPSAVSAIPNWNPVLHLLACLKGMVFEPKSIIKGAFPIM